MPFLWGLCGIDTHSHHPCCTRSHCRHRNTHTVRLLRSVYAYTDVPTIAALFYSRPLFCNRCFRNVQGHCIHIRIFSHFAYIHIQTHEYIRTMCSGRPRGVHIWRMSIIHKSKTGRTWIAHRITPFHLKRNRLLVWLYMGVPRMYCKASTLEHIQINAMCPHTG